MSDLHEFVGHWGYLAIFVVVMLGNVGLPVPEETILALAGYLVWRGELRLSLVLAVGIVSAVVGDNIGYWLGRRYGQTAMPRYARWVLGHPERLEAMKAFVGRRGPMAVFVARFVPGVRFTAGPLAGALGPALLALPHRQRRGRGRLRADGGGRRLRGRLRLRASTWSGCATWSARSSGSYWSSCCSASSASSAVRIVQAMPARRGLSHRGDRTRGAPVAAAARAQCPLASPNPSEPCRRSSVPGMYRRSSSWKCETRAITWWLSVGMAGLEPLERPLRLLLVLHQLLHGVPHRVHRGVGAEERDEDELVAELAQLPEA